MKNAILFAALTICCHAFCQNDNSPEATYPVENADPSKVKDKVYMVVEVMPQYPGGEEAMMRFIQSNIRYPDLERENDIQGRVVVVFVVNEDGSLSDIEIRKSVSKGIDKEAARVVSLMPKFKPGTQQGKAVRVSYMLPIMFKLAAPVPPVKK